MKITEFLDNQQQEIAYTPEDFTFISRVLNNISQGMKLPLNLDSVDVITQIQNRTNQFYQDCPWATVDDRVVYDLSKLNRPIAQIIGEEASGNFMTIANDTIILPGKVEDVFRVRWHRRGYGFLGAFDYASWKLEAMMTTGPMNAYHNMIGSDTYMASVYVSNTLRSMSAETVAYDFNQLTKEMRIYDCNSREGIIDMEVAKRIPLSALYMDEWYFQYISAHVIIAKCEHMQMFDAKLPGDLNLNISQIQTRGENMLTYVKEYLEQETEHHFNFIKD